MKSGSAILIMIIILSIISISMFSLLDSYGQALEASKKRMVEYKKIYFIEGVVNLCIDNMKSHLIPINSKFKLQDCNIVISNKDKKILIEAEFEGKKVKAFLNESNYKIILWETN